MPVATWARLSYLNWFLCFLSTKIVTNHENQSVVICVCVCMYTHAHIHIYIIIEAFSHEIEQFWGPGVLGLG